MNRLARALAKTVWAVAMLALLPDLATAQCPSRNELSLFGGQGFDGDEPDDYTHYVDENGDGVCDFSGDANQNGSCDEPSCAAVVAWNATAGVHPNGVYPDCMLVLYEEGTQRAEFILQLGHSHWEYTRLHSDTGGAPDEKDYLTVTQAMQTDFQNGDSSGTATRASIAETIDFLTGEPGRFERFLLTNPSGRYWQVDEWIGPAVTPPGAGAPIPVPILTWTERFFACGGADQQGTSDCARVNGTPAFGGYWSDHAEQLGYQSECGNGELDDPAPELDDPVDPDRRSEACGILFVECGG